MSKSKTILAGLGVVAALGTAALPLASYATPNATNVGVSGNVDLYVEVMPAIAMTIVGNNDHHELYTDLLGDSETDNHAATGNAAVDVMNPNTTSASGQTVASPYTVDGHTEAHTTTSSSSYTSLLPNSKVEGGNFKSTVTVYTNNVTGYNLTAIDADASADLVHFDPTGKTATIPATSATTLNAGTAAWGYRVASKDGASLNATDWLAMPITPAEGTATPATIGTEDIKTSAGTAYEVEYGVATAADQATGVYRDTIIYTTTTK
ncbi:hypothetical protein IJ765_00735 [Candidatus Saccharibacteria bacterium]|nr:hypothetical protein [Candidatus Saccharibacteria bacterium]